jgi:hypothetical protein
MSLISTASPWINNEPKKRISTMRKTIKNKSTPENIQEYNNTENYLEDFKNTTPNTIEETQQTQTENTNKVNELLNKITAFNADNDGSKLANFTPLDNPTIINRKTDTEIQYQSPFQYNPTDLLPNKMNITKDPGNYTANNLNTSNYTEFNHIYENSPKLFQKQPYYSNLAKTGNDFNDKIMEKMNYMIHLLEEQQNAQTSNITEDFIMYMLLGIFVIYVVDSFTGSVKYTR